jgi:hypothetical protein
MSLVLQPAGSDWAETGMAARRTRIARTGVTNALNGVIGPL